MAIATSDSSDIAVSAVGYRVGAWHTACSREIVASHTSYTYRNRITSDTGTDTRNSIDGGVVVESRSR
jgi:hypothetical protein